MFKPFNKPFRIWVNRCIECGNYPYISLRKHKARMCRKCSKELRQAYKPLEEGTIVEVGSKDW